MFKLERAQPRSLRRERPIAQLPHIIAEFRLGCYVYVYAIPFSDRDSGDLGFFDEPEFLDTFRQYAAVGQWKKQDLSGQKKITMMPQLKFMPRNPPASPAA
jgi:hypothetical protein